MLPLMDFPHSSDEHWIDSSRRLAERSSHSCDQHECLANGSFYLRTMIEIGPQLQCPRLFNSEEPWPRWLTRKPSTLERC